MLYSEMMQNSAALLNDTAQTNFDNETLLPYLNMAIVDLREIFELNNIPVTNQTTPSVITVPAGTSKIGFTTIPTLPARLVEIRQLFESVVDQNLWVPVVRKQFLTGVILPPTQIVNFGVWAWIDQEINVPPCITDVDLKIDYIKSIFPNPLTLANINMENTVINTDSYLYTSTAALASRYIDENETRANSLDMRAMQALQRSLGISVKGMQSIMTRRRPFRASWRQTSRRLF